MTATADIVTMQKKGVLLVPAAALRFSPDRQRGGSGGGLTSVLAPRPMRRGGGGGAAREAAIGRGSKQTVYVVGDAGDTPQPVEITVGDSNGSQAEVIGGKLAEGAEVVIGQYAAGAEGGGQGGGQAGGRRRNAQ